MRALRMTPRDPQPLLAAVLRTAGRSLARACALLLLLGVPVMAPEASAMVTSVSATPSQPATCDSVTLRGEGMISTCEYLHSGEVFGPVLIPDTAGAVPVYRTRILFTGLPQNTAVPCIPLSPYRYAPEFPLGRLPM